MSFVLSKPKKIALGCAALAGCVVVGYCVLSGSQQSTQGSAPQDAKQENVSATNPANGTSIAGSSQNTNNLAAPVAPSVPDTKTLPQNNKVAETTTGAPPVGGLPPQGAPQVGAPVAKAEAPKPVVAVQACYNLSFRHKPTIGHTDADACSNHRNLIRIKSGEINRKALCVRVDGTPVNYDLKSTATESHITIGSIAGPGSKISVRYCTGKATCAEDCTIPKDEFMAAIGGDDEGTHAAAHKVVSKAKKGKSAKWDPKDNEKDTEISEEVEAEIEKELAGDKALAIFEGWTQESETAACGQTVSLLTKSQ